MKKKAYLLMSVPDKFLYSNKQIIFAGKQYLNKEKLNEIRRKKLKINYLKGNIYSTKNLIKEFDYCNSIYLKLLKELSRELNKIHGLSWCERSWEILIGVWLNRFIAVINNRFNILKEFQKNFEPIYNNSLKKNSTTLISSDLIEFNKKNQKSGWNEKLIYRIHKILEAKKIDKSYLDKINSKSFNSSKIIRRKKINYIFGNKVNFLLNILYKLGINKCVFNRIYSGSTFSTIRLFFKLGEIPTKFFFSDIYFKEKFITKLRKKININLNIGNKKERLIRLMLLEMFPTVYLEGFKRLKKMLKEQNLPKNKIIIYSRNIWKNDLFNFWVANQVNNGSKLISGQHGIGYGMSKRSFGDFFEPRISDKYFNWGQKVKIKNVIRSTIPSKDILLNSKNQKKNVLKNKKILIVCGFGWDYLIRNSLFNGFYEKFISIENFAEKISKSFRKHILIKPHPKEIVGQVNFSKIISKKFDNEVKILEKKQNVSNFILEARISVFTSMGTEFLKTLVLNRPCIYLVQNSELKNLNENALKYFRDLHKNNIVHFNGLNAAKFINNNLGNIEKWWFSHQTQKSIKNFTNEFACTNDNLYQRFEKTLIDVRKTI